MTQGVTENEKNEKILMKKKDNNRQDSGRYSKFDG